MKRLADALGHVRDVDVTCAWLEDALGTLPADSPARAGIQRLIDERRAARHDPDRALAQVLDRFVGDVYPRLQRRLDRAHVAGRMAGKRMRKPLSRALDKLGKAQTATLASPDPETAHDLRIRAKKLRYRGEVLEPALPGVVPELLARLQHLQELLGDLHDADVRRPLLERFLVQVEPHQRPGALELLQRTLLDRERLGGELATELRVWEGEGIIAHLRMLLR